ncbi:MAG: tyrosine-type recombinase/integrase [Betaproteobacteria bacterium]|nr:tyrosine-type recombinase/integrase [Betaproteobacteria bacterium]
MGAPDDSGQRALADIERAFDPGGGPPTRIRLFEGGRRAYVRFLRARNRLIEPKAEDRFARLRREYAQHLIEFRGLSGSARSYHAYTVADFLVRGVGSRNLSALTQSDVEAFVVLRGRELSRHSMQHVVGHMRAFLRFCYERGHLGSRLDQAIDTPRTYRDELPPRALPWRTVQSLLASIDRASKSGWRDYCILHLISHYGLRPSEVVSLRMDSIDWERGVLSVKQHKTRSSLTWPLAAATIRVLTQYLALERDRQGWTYPELFLRARCPNGPLQSTAVGNIFEKRMRAAKLGGSSDAYSLRHAFAMRLLARGVGVKVIGDLLGHRRLDSTCTYLRLHTAALRGVALEVPCNLTRPGGRHGYA